MLPGAKENPPPDPVGAPASTAPAAAELAARCVAAASLAAAFSARAACCFSTNSTRFLARLEPYCGTRYLGTDGRWDGANSPIGPWSHGYEGGAGRGYRTPSIALIA